MPAFCDYAKPQRLEHSTTTQLSAFSPTCCLTRGIRAVCGQQVAADSSQPARPVSASLSLPDGRLKVGTDLPLLARRYQYLSLIGEGRSAQVILAQDTAALIARLVVIKVLKRQFSTAGHKEVKALRFLHGGGAAFSAGLVELYSAFTYMGHTCLVLERLQGSLLDYIVHSASLNRTQAMHNLRLIAVQLLGTLALMHGRGVVHADIKPENVLLITSPGCPPVASPVLRRICDDQVSPSPAGAVSKTGAKTVREVLFSLGAAGVGQVHVKLIDLGNCFSIGGTDASRLSFEMQTLPFRAPEALLGGACGTGIDIWSLGCLLAEVALQRPLFPVSTPAELVSQMTAQLGALPADLRHQSSYHLTAAAAATPSPRAPTRMNTAAPTAPRQLSTAASLQSNAYCPAEPSPMRANPGPLKLWHEDACPLHLELAKVDPCMASLVMSMLQLNPRDRVSAADALKHTFFAGVCPTLQVPFRGARAVKGCVGSAAHQPDQATAGHVGGAPHQPDQATMRHMGIAPQQPDQPMRGGLDSNSQQPDQATIRHVGSAPHQPDQASMRHVGIASQRPDATTVSLGNAPPQPDQAGKGHATQTLAQPDQATPQPGIALPLVRVCQSLSPELNEGTLQHLPHMALQHDKARSQHPNQASPCSAQPVRQDQGKVTTALIPQGPAGGTALRPSLPSICLLPSSMPSSQQPIQATHSFPKPIADALGSAMQLKSNPLKAELPSKPANQTPAPSREFLGGRLRAGASSEKEVSEAELASQTPAPSGGVLQDWLGVGMSSGKAPGTAEALAGVTSFVDSLTPVTQVKAPPQSLTQALQTAAHIHTPASDATPPQTSPASPHTSQLVILQPRIPSANTSSPSSLRNYHRLARPSAAESLQQQQQQALQDDRHRQSADAAINHAPAVVRAAAGMKAAGTAAGADDTAKSSAAAHINAAITAAPGAAGLGSAFNCGSLNKCASTSDQTAGSGATADANTGITAAAAITAANATATVSAANVLSQLDSRQVTAQHSRPPTAQQGEVTASSFLALCLEAASRSPSKSPNRGQPRQQQLSGNAQLPGAEPASANTAQHAQHAGAQPASAHTACASEGFRGRLKQRGVKAAVASRSAAAKQRSKAVTAVAETALLTAACQALNQSVHPASKPVVFEGENSSQQLQAQHASNRETTQHAVLPLAEAAHSSSGRTQTHAWTGATESTSVKAAQQSNSAQVQSQVKVGAKRSRLVAVAQQQGSTQAMSQAKVAGKQSTAGIAQQQRTIGAAMPLHAVQDSELYHAQRSKHSMSDFSAQQQQQHSGAVADTGMGLDCEPRSEQTQPQVSHGESQQPVQTSAVQQPAHSGAAQHAQQHAQLPLAKQTGRAPPADSKLSTVAAAEPPALQQSRALPGKAARQPGKKVAKQQRQSMPGRKGSTVRKHSQGQAEQGSVVAAAATLDPVKHDARDTKGTHAQQAQHNMLDSPSASKLKEQHSMQGAAAVAGGSSTLIDAGKHVQPGKQEAALHKEAACKRSSSEVDMHDSRSAHASKRQMRSRQTDNKPWWVV